VRVEDIDTPRVIRGSEERIVADLEWLGLRSDEPVCRQSERTTLYEDALLALERRGRVYVCDCSRADIARIASAPHPGDELVYPGTCREKEPARALKKDPSLRFRVLPDDRVAFTDLVEGAQDPALVQEGGDFVLRRGDGLFSYQLAVAVDDLAMGITDVARGVDLLPSTPRQLLLMKTLSGGLDLPRYAHVPLVVGPTGERLAKRTPGATVRELRERGTPPEAVLGQLAHGLGLVETPDPIGVSDLASRLEGHELRFRREPWRIPG
jgi:glutamyl-tRNA synthetase